MLNRNQLASHSRPFPSAPGCQSPSPLPCDVLHQKLCHKLGIRIRLDSWEDETLCRGEPVSMRVTGRDGQQNRLEHGRKDWMQVGPDLCR